MQFTHDDKHRQRFSIFHKNILQTTEIYNRKELKIELSPIYHNKKAG
jgi:hypothetical protein